MNADNSGLLLQAPERFISVEKKGFKPGPHQTHSFEETVQLNSIGHFLGNDA